MKLNVCPITEFPWPSSTSNWNESLVLLAPLWTKTSRLLLMSSCVKLVTATPGLVVNSSWPLAGAVVTL